MTQDRARKLLRGKANPERMRKLMEAPENAILVRCTDEKTGCRFGNRIRRKGMCLKVGKGAGYQLWATWSPWDLQNTERR